jgi:hypothetical protein
VCERLRVLLKVAAVLGGMMAGALPSCAGEPVVLAKLVELADRRPAFVAILLPSVTKHCMRTVWGQIPPKVFRTWAETLLLDDLANRAMVRQGTLTKDEAVARRQALFLSLEHVGPEALEAIGIYTSAKPGGEFGRDLTRVMDCQYRSVAAALSGIDES